MSLSHLSWSLLVPLCAGNSVSVVSGTLSLPAIRATLKPTPSRNAPCQFWEWMISVLLLSLSCCPRLLCPSPPKTGSGKPLALVTGLSSGFSLHWTRGFVLIVAIWMTVHQIKYSSNNTEWLFLKELFLCLFPYRKQWIPVQCRAGDNSMSWCEYINEFIYILKSTQVNRAKISFLVGCGVLRHLNSLMMATEMCQNNV